MESFEKGVVDPRPSLPVVESNKNPEAPPFPKRIDDEAEIPAVKSIKVDVEFAAVFQLVVGVYEKPPSVPQKRIPPVVDFTSQAALVRFKIARDVVVAFVANKFPAVSAVLDAYGKTDAVTALEVIAPDVVMAPVLDIEKSVEVANVAVLLPIEKSVVGLTTAPAVVLAFAKRESSAEGEELPIPILPEVNEILLLLDVALNH